MQIGLIIYGDLDTRSGGYLYDRRLVQELKKAGDEVEVISIPYRGYVPNLIDNFSSFILERCRSGGFDILLQDELNHPSLFILNRRLRRQSSLPFVSIVHHLRRSEKWPPLSGWLYERIEKAYLATLDGVICNSKTTANNVHDLVEIPSMVMVPGKDHIQPSLDEEWIATRALREGPIQLLFLGNVIARKGLLNLLDAVTRLPLDGWQLTVVGDLTIDPTYTTQVKYKIADRGLENNVRLTGPLPPLQLAKMLIGSDLLVVPSQYEGFGIVYLEGMGFGIPSVATTAGGASELVRDGENGYLVDPGDVQGLIEILKCILSDRERLRDLSLGALHTYQEHPTWGAGAEQARQFLQSMIH